MAKKLSKRVVRVEKAIIITYDDDSKTTVKYEDLCDLS